MDETAIKTLNELASLIPPLSKDEFEGLESSILKYGQRDPIQIGFIQCSSPKEWFVIDGHNRLAICKKHNIKPFYDECAIDFETIEDAQIWLINNQLGKRNLLPAQRIYLAMKKEDIFKAQAHKRMIGGVKVDPSPNLDKGEKVDPNAGRTSTQVAEQAGVGRTTYDKGKYVFQNADEETKEAYQKGDLSTDEAYKKAKKITEEKPPKPEPSKADKATKAACRAIETLIDLSNEGRLKFNHIEDLKTAEETLVYVINNFDGEK